MNLFKKHQKEGAYSSVSVSIPWHPQTPVTFYERSNALIKQNKVCFFEVSACHLDVK